jgi:hypothetical protein
MKLIWQDNVGVARLYDLLIFYLVVVSYSGRNIKVLVPNLSLLEGSLAALIRLWMEIIKT